MTYSMTPMLVSSDDSGSVILVVKMPGTVGIDEHAIGIVHEVLGVDRQLQLNHDPCE